MQLNSIFKLYKNLIPWSKVHWENDYSYMWDDVSTVEPNIQTHILNVVYLYRGDRQLLYACDITPIYMLLLLVCLSMEYMPSLQPTKLATVQCYSPPS